MWLFVAFIDTQIFQLQNLMSVICSLFWMNYLLKTNVILMSDFNMDLRHYETHNQNRDFLDKMFSASLKLHIAAPTTHCRNSSK